MATINALSSATAVGVPTPKPHGPVHQEQTTTGSTRLATDGPQYLSPVVNVEPNTGIAVLVVRDTSTGESITQYPARQIVDEYSKKMKANEAQHPSAPQPVEAQSETSSDHNAADKKSA